MKYKYIVSNVSLEDICKSLDENKIKYTIGNENAPKFFAFIKCDKSPKKFMELMPKQWQDGIINPIKEDMLSRERVSLTIRASNTCFLPVE